MAAIIDLLLDTVARKYFMYHKYILIRRGKIEMGTFSCKNKAFVGL